MTNEKHFSKHFNPDIAFFDLPLIRRTLLLGSLFVIGLVVIISAVDWRESDWSATGFNELIAMFKLPIGLLAFFAALLALFATNHRSEQNRQAMALTQASIDATGAQNRFSNYYKHIEEFEKHCKSVVEYFDKDLYFINGRSLYHHIFEIGEDNVGHLKVISIDHAHNFNCNFIEMLESLKGRGIDHEESTKSIETVMVKFKEFLLCFDNQFGIQAKALKLDSEKGNAFLFGPVKKAFPDGSVKKLFEMYISCIKILDLLMQYDLQYFNKSQSADSNGRINEIERATLLVERIEGGQVSNWQLVTRPYIEE